jgi:hypothetical protein
MEFMPLMGSPMVWMVLMCERGKELYLGPAFGICEWRACMKFVRVSSVLWFTTSVIESFWHKVAVYSQEIS